MATASYEEKLKLLSDTKFKSDQKKNRHLVQKTPSQPLDANPLQIKPRSSSEDKFEKYIKEFEQQQEELNA